MSIREEIMQNPTGYLILGDLDKPFHRPECECDDCEKWRHDNERPTHAEIRGTLQNNRYLQKYVLSPKPINPQ